MWAYIRALFFWSVLLTVTGYAALLLFSHKALNQLVTFLILGEVPGTDYTVSFYAAIVMPFAAASTYTLYRLIRKYVFQVKTARRETVTLRLQA